MPIGCPECNETVEFSDTKIYDFKQVGKAVEVLVCCPTCYPKVLRRRRERIKEIEDELKHLFGDRPMARAELENEWLELSKRVEMFK